MSTVIATHDLTKRYGGKTAVDRLTLQVPAGSIFALLFLLPSLAAFLIKPHGAAKTPA